MHPSLFLLRPRLPSHLVLRPFSADNRVILYVARLDFNAQLLIIKVPTAALFEDGEDTKPTTLHQLTNFWMPPSVFKMKHFSFYTAQTWALISQSFEIKLVVPNMCTHNCNSYQDMFRMTQGYRPVEHI